MQFAVQALIPDFDAESGATRDDWRDVYTTPWALSSHLDRELIAQCRSVADSAERFYVLVRVIQRNENSTIKVMSR